MTRIIISLFVLSFFIGVNNTIAQDTDSENFIKLEQKPPDFKVRTIDNKNITLSKLKGKVVLVNFWATWCGPCMAEMPFLEKDIWQKYKSENFILIAIAREEDMDKIKEFNKSKNFSFFLAPDPDRKIYSKYANKYIPSNYLIDKNGLVCYMSKGFNQDEFKKLVELIGEKIKEN